MNSTLITVKSIFPSCSKGITPFEERGKVELYLPLINRTDNITSPINTLRTFFFPGAGNTTTTVKESIGRFCIFNYSTEFNLSDTGIKNLLFSKIKKKMRVNTPEVKIAYSAKLLETR